MNLDQLNEILLFWESECDFASENIKDVDEQEAYLESQIYNFVNSIKNKFLVKQTNKVLNYLYGRRD